MTKVKQQTIRFPIDISSNQTLEATAAQFRTWIFSVGLKVSPKQAATDRLPIEPLKVYNCSSDDRSISTAMHSPSAICQAHLGKRGDRHHGGKGPKEAVESVCQDSPLDVLVKLIA